MWLLKRSLEPMFKLKILYYYLLTKFFRRFTDRKKLEAFQKRKMAAHLEWVKQHSPFYRESKGEIIDKKVMMENFSRLNTIGIDRDEAFKVAFAAENSRDFSSTLNGVTVGLSSGTSGNRGLFLVSNEERARHAGTILAKILPRSILSKNRVAFFMRANSNLYTASQSSRVIFEFFDLLKPVNDHFQKLNALDPTLLFAPPSMLIQLASAQASGAIQVNPLKIFSIAETLDPLDQKKIEKAFGQKVHQIYQCTEGFLGATCSEGVLHLNEDCVHIEQEWLDESHTKFIPVVTDFSRTSQPIIRYRLNDILTIRKTPCPCGSALMALECIEGRSDDVIYFLDVNGERVPVFPDFIRRAILTSSDQIDEYMVKQSTDAELDIFIKSVASMETLKRAITDEMVSLSKILHAELPSLRFHDSIPSLEGKKLRRVMRT